MGNTEREKSRNKKDETWWIRNRFNPSPMATELDFRASGWEVLRWFYFDTSGVEANKI